MEDNINIYKTKSENEDAEQPSDAVQPSGALQSSVYGQQPNQLSFADIVQQGPANYRSPSVDQPMNTDPQPPFGQQPNTDAQPPFGQPTNTDAQSPFGQQPNFGQSTNTEAQPPFGQQPNFGQPTNADAQSPFGQQPNFGQPTNADAQSPFGQQPNFGQPTNAGQPPYYTQPSQGLQYQEPKKGKAGIVIAIIAVLVVLAGGIGAFMLLKDSAMFASKDPVKMLERGLELRMKESEAYTTSLDEELGAAAIEERKEKDPYHTNVNLSFTIPASYDLDNIGIEVDALTDKNSKMGEYELSVGTYGFKISVGNVITAGSMLYFASPFFTDGTYYIDLENIEEDFKNSPWVDALELELPEGYSVELFEDVAEGTSMENELKELSSRYAALIEENREIALLSEPKEFTIHGKTEKCRGVSVTISKDAMNEWIEGFKTEFMDTNYYKTLLDRVASQQALDGMELEEYQQEADAFMEALFGVRFEQDYVLHVYMDSKGRIINQSTPEDIQLSGSDIERFSLDFNYLGDERAMDIIDGFCYFGSDDSAWYLGIDRNAEVSDEAYKEEWAFSFGEVDGFELGITYKNDWDYSEKGFDMQITLLITDEYGYTDDFTVTADGAYTGIVKGEAYTLEIDNATLSYGNETLVMMSGKIVREFTNDVIEIPETSVNFFDLTEEELEDLLFGSSSSLYY